MNKFLFFIFSLFICPFNFSWASEPFTNPSSSPFYRIPSAAVLREHFGQMHPKEEFQKKINVDRMRAYLGEEFLDFFGGLSGKSHELDFWETIAEQRITRRKLSQVLSLWLGNPGVMDFAIVSAITRASENID